MSSIASRHQNKGDRIGVGGGRGVDESVITNCPPCLERLTQTNPIFVFHKNISLFQATFLIIIYLVDNMQCLLVKGATTTRNKFVSNDPDSFSLQFVVNLVC